MTEVKNKTEIDSEVGRHREAWLGIARRLAVSLFQRRNLELYDLCDDGVRGEAAPDALEKYARLRARIAAIAAELAEAEDKAKGTLGFSALLGTHDIHPGIVNALALLTAKALSHEVGLRVDDVAELAEHAVSSQSAQDLVAVREAFARGGILRSHCHLQLRHNVGESRHVCLTERAIRTVLGLALEPAVEFEVLAERYGWKGE